MHDEKEMLISKFFFRFSRRRGYTSINAVVKAELFPVKIRTLGVGLPYALTVAIFGGTAEYIAWWFKKIGHEDYFYWYITGMYCYFSFGISVYGRHQTQLSFGWSRTAKKLTNRCVDMSF